MSNIIVLDGIKFWVGDDECWYFASAELVESHSFLVERDIGPLAVSMLDEIARLREIAESLSLTARHFISNGGFGHFSEIAAAALALQEWEAHSGE